MNYIISLTLKTEQMETRTFEEILEGDYHVTLEDNRRDESIKLAVDKFTSQSPTGISSNKVADWVERLRTVEYSLIAKDVADEMQQAIKQSTEKKGEEAELKEKFFVKMREFAYEVSVNTKIDSKNYTELVWKWIEENILSIQLPQDKTEINWDKLIVEYGNANYPITNLENNVFIFLRDKLSASKQ